VFVISYKHFIYFFLKTCVLSSHGLPDEIVDIGYKYAKPKVKAWAEANGFKAPPCV
jgi:hypothetical protein